MKQKTGRKLLGILLALAMVIGLMPGMSLTAWAAGTTWSENQNITATDTISGGVAVTADITLTIPDGVTLTVNGGIDVTGHTLTVSGKGTLVVNGATGSTGQNGGERQDGGRGGDGGSGITGNLTVESGTVTVTGGTGGTGGDGGSGEGPSDDGAGTGGNGGDGGSGILGNLMVKNGTVTVTGGVGGNGGSADDSSLLGGSGNVGVAVTGTITGSAEESSDNSTWAAITGGTSSLRYVKVESAPSIAVTGVTLNPSDAQTIDVDGTVSFTATVAPDNATDKTVKWSVGGTDAGAVKLYTNEACTTEVGAEATDVLTVYAKGISAGSATVTATSNVDSEKSASCDVTVNKASAQPTIDVGTTWHVGDSINLAGKYYYYYPEPGDFDQSVNRSGTVPVPSFNAFLNSWCFEDFLPSCQTDEVDGYWEFSGAIYIVLPNGKTASDTPTGFKISSGSGTEESPYTFELVYDAAPATHSVTITPGSNMTKTAASGAESQADLSSAMTDVVYTADDGYYFPENYSVAEVNGIKVTRNSYTEIKVSGTPTADAAITLTAPTAKATSDAPTTAAAVDCTTTDNNDGKLTGVTTAMEYKKSDATEWTAGTGNDISGLVPGTYYVRVKATDTTLASDNQELTIKGFISYTVTFKVVNGKWDDDTTADKTVILTGHDGDSLKLTTDQIPAVGTKPSDTYKAGSWNVVPSTETAITEATTYTYTYAEKEAAVVTKAPTAKTLTYNGSAQALVTAGTAEGGTMYYAVTTENTAPTDDNLYTTSIPTATNAGTYYVWYKVVGDTNHSDTTPDKVSVTVAKAEIEPAASIEGWTYGEDAKTPSVTGNSGDGAVTYTYAEKGSTDFSETVPTAAGEYTVRATIAETANYKSGEATADFTIQKKSSGSSTPGGGSVTRYPVKAADAEGGTVKTSVERAASGSKVTVTATPDEGYEVDEIKVTDKNGKEIAVKKNDDGTYSFTQPASDVTVTVTFKEAADESELEPETKTGYNTCSKDTDCPMNEFTDLDPNAWYHDGVHFCIENGMMNGVGDNKFDPDGTTSRGMIVTILYRLEGKPEITAENPFDDVEAGKWYTDAVILAAENKIVDGYGGSKFGPNDDITREQLATILYRYAQYKGLDVSVGEDTNILSFGDTSEVSGWASAAMRWAVGSGIINGKDGNRLDPMGNAIRAEAAAMIQRFCENTAE